MGRRLEFGMTGAPQHVTYTINGVPFSCETPGPIPLNAVEEWEIYNQTNDPHPFHIHVNPFQMVSGGNVDPGLWLDTVELPPNKRVRFRTRFLDYTGLFAFHCHTLPHEDMGMTQAVKVVKSSVKRQLVAFSFTNNSYKLRIDRLRARNARRGKPRESIAPSWPDQSSISE